MTIREEAVRYVGLVVACEEQEYGIGIVEVGWSRGVQGSVTKELGGMG